MSRVVVAIGADDAYALPLTVTAFSAAANLRPGEGMDIYVLDGGLSPESRERFAGAILRAGRDVRTRFVAPQVGLLRTSGVPDGNIGLMAYLRVLVPDSLPAAETHAIYLDSDLFVRASLADLWELRSDGAAVAGVPDFGAPVVSSPSSLANWWQLGLPEQAPYVNTGVLLMDLTAWRSGDVGRRILEYSVQHKESNRYAEQDGLNAICAREARTIDPMWNVPAYLAFDSVFDILDASPVKEWARPRRAALLRDAHVIHFVGRRKPWSKGLVTATQVEWLQYAWRSGWFQGRSLEWARLVSSLALDAAMRSGFRLGRRAVRALRRPALNSLEERANVHQAPGPTDAKRDPLK
jgi:lipopolysaccharide biosynthesis glycosyltransferase